MYYAIACEHRDRYHQLDEELTDLQTRAIAEEELTGVCRRIEEAYAQRESMAVISITFRFLSIHSLKVMVSYFVASGNFSGSAV